MSIVSTAESPVTPRRQSCQALMAMASRRINFCSTCTETRERRGERRGERSGERRGERSGEREEMREKKRELKPLSYDHVHTLSQSGCQFR